MPRVDVVGEEGEGGQRKGCTSKHDYPTLEIQPESLIYEAVYLISIDDSSVKLTRNGNQNNLYLHLAREGHCQKKNVDNSLLFRSESASTPVAVKWRPHSLRMSSHNAMTCKHGH